MKVGERLRQSRQSQNLTIDEIAGSSNLSRAYISQIETGKASPSLPSLEKLADALQIPMAALFEEKDETFTCEFIPKAERKVLMFGPPDGPASNRKLVHFLSAPNREIEVCILEVAPGLAATDADHHHDGEEVFYVMKGNILVEHDSKEYSLGPGDCIHLNATIAHRILNTGTETAEIFVSRTPHGFSQLEIGPPEKFS